MPKIIEIESIIEVINEAAIREFAKCEFVRRNMGDDEGARQEFDANPISHALRWLLIDAVADIPGAQFEDSFAKESV